MSGLIAGLLSITLEEAGKEIGLNILGAGTAQLFNFIFDNDQATQPDPAIKKELDDILQGLDKLQSKIADIGKEVAELKIDLKTDLVQIFVNNLNALYVQYVLTYKSLAKIAFLEPSKEKQKRYTKTRQEVTRLGQQVQENILAIVENIHNFVAGREEKSILALVNAQAKTGDFFTYFCQMRATLLSYWAIELKALTLLQLVTDDSEVNFPEGPELIDRVKGYIKQQGDFFDQLVPKVVATLANSWAKTEVPTGITNVQFQAQEHRFIWGSTAANDVICHTDETQMKPWALTPVEALYPLDLTIKRYFRLSFGGAYLATGADPSCGASTYSSAGPVPFDPQLYWLIQSSGAGFTLQYISRRDKDPFNNFHLTSMVQSNVPALGNNKDQGSQFMIVPVEHT